MKLIARATKSLLMCAMLMICLSVSAKVGTPSDTRTGTPSDTEVRRDRDGFVEGQNFKDGSCWVILFVRVLPEAETAYYNYLDEGWKKQQDILKKEGVILSYKVLRTNMVHKNDYNVMLMTEYRDRAALDEAQQGTYDAVGRMISGSDEKVVLAFRERAHMRTLFGGKITKEVILR